MQFEYHPAKDAEASLLERLGQFPRNADLSWDGLRWLGSWFNFLFIRTQFRLSVQGNLPTAPKVAIVANHQSHLDTATLLAALPYLERKQISVLAAEDYFFKSTPKALLASLLCQGIAFDRDSGFMSIRHWYESLKQIDKGWILFYPSGSRHETEIHTGLLKCLLKENWTIVPAQLTGTDIAWPVHSKQWKPFSPLQVRFGIPYHGQDINALVQHLKKELYP